MKKKNKSGQHPVTKQQHFYREFPFMLQASKPFSFATQTKMALPPISSINNASPIQCRKEVYNVIK